MRWLELVTLAGLLLAADARGRDRERHRWRTPLDGRIAAMLAVLLFASFGGGPAGHGLELRLLLGAVAAYYTAATLLARDGRACEAAWRVFAAAAGLLGLHALWATTSGLAHLAALSVAADAAWHARHGLLSTLALATLLTAGRALERGSAPLWRLAAVVGATGTVLHLVATGSPFATSSLARLEDPLGFSSIVVIIIVLKRAGFDAWTLGRERSAERGRWWGVLAVAVFVATGVLFRPGPPGEGLVLLVAFCGALLAAARTLPGTAPAAAAAVVEAPATKPRRAA
ncbi:MAG: hypothetical protein IT347_09360 [Candidatus Eisenbacteria bacterium]|nr:hypothetical protein [Candidatus Eisenbacteria bacterium]